MVEESWWRLVPELKDPLLTMSFMPFGIECLPGGKELGQRSVLDHARDLAEILEHLAQGAEGRDCIEFSNSLESKLLPWLRRIAHALRRFNSPE